MKIFTKVDRFGRILIAIGAYKTDHISECNSINVFKANRLFKQYVWSRTGSIVIVPKRIAVYFVACVNYTVFYSNQSG